MNGFFNSGTWYYRIFFISVCLLTKLLSAVQYNGPVYRSSDWVYGNLSKTVYGLDYYMTTKHYRDHPYDEPTVCFNAYDLKEGKFGYFICPGRRDHHLATLCCGDLNREQCCREGQDPKSSSIVLWLVLGGFASIFVLAGLKFLWAYLSDGCCQWCISECCSPTVEYFRDMCSPCVERISCIGNCCHRKENTRDCEVNELEGVHIEEKNEEKWQKTGNGDTHEVEPLNA